MVYLMVFGLTVLMIINLVLFHTVFTVFYFDFGRGIIGEILWGYVVAGFEVILVMAVGRKIFVQNDDWRTWRWISMSLRTGCLMR